MTEINPQQLASLVQILGKFKDLKHNGWVEHKVSMPESDADHSFSVAFLVMLFAPKHLDKLRCLQLALIHDLAEIYSGDILPIDLPPKFQKEVSEELKQQNKDKFMLETKAMQRVAQELNYPELLELFEEYELKNTPESRFVNAMDKTENVFSSAYLDATCRSSEPTFPEFSSYALKKVRAMNSTDAQISEQIIKEIIKLNQ